MTACQSYRRTQSFCADGFFQSAAFCSGGSVGCSSCGNISERALPDCLLDEPRHIVLNAETRSLNRKDSSHGY